MKIDNGSKPIPQHIQRLQAHKERADRNARQHEMRLKNNVSYAKGNVPQIVSAEVVAKLSNSNPTAAKLLEKVLPIGKGEPVSAKDTLDALAPHLQNGTKENIVVERKKKRLAFQKISPEHQKEVISLVKKIAVPIILTLAQRQLLAMGLKGGGGLVRSIIRKAFR